MLLVFPFGFACAYSYTSYVPLFLPHASDLHIASYRDCHLLHLLHGYAILRSFITRTFTRVLWFLTVYREQSVRLSFRCTRPVGWHSIILGLLCHLSQLHDLAFGMRPALNKIQFETLLQGIIALHKVGL
ncbi:hypothetical protein FPV67DRAFT_276021 [Lyophyllum atratum]|nr:hypothetical protein FPV67DRAFT_276021 [Lyophyllum atratum]